MNLVKGTVIEEGKIVSIYLLEGRLISEETYDEILGNYEPCMCEDCQADDDEDYEDCDCGECSICCEDDDFCDCDECMCDEEEDDIEELDTLIDSYFVQNFEEGVQYFDEDIKKALKDAYLLGYEDCLIDK